MKSMDKPLVAIVVAIGILVVGAIIVVLIQPTPDYMPEGEPQACVYNYLLSIVQGEYERSYTYLSPNIPGYPQTFDDFVDDVRHHSYQFRLDRDVSFDVQSVYTSGRITYVVIQETRFNSGDVLSPSYSRRSVEFEVVNEGGEWRIIDAEGYFAYCWRFDEGCN